MKRYLTLILAFFACAVYAQNEPSTESSIASFRMGGAYYNGGGTGKNIGISLGKNNFMGEIDFLDANGSKQINDKAFKDGISLRIGFYRNIAENSIFSISAGYASNNFALYETYLDSTLHDYQSRKIGNESYSALSLHSGVMHGLNKYVGVGVKAVVDYSEKAFNAGLVGYISINFFGWDKSLQL